MIKTALACLVLVFTCYIIQPAFAAPDDEYVYILGARGNPYWTALSDGIHDAATEKNVHAVVLETENDSDAEGQLNICQTAIQRKPKLIAMESINPAIGLTCFKEAAAAGIIVADIDAHLTLEEAAKAGIMLAYTVGSDNTQIGRAAARYVASSVGKPDPKILIIEGAAGSLTSQKRVEGFRDGIKQDLPAATIVASISANWDRLKAMSLTSDALQRQPDIDVVYAANDGMALGASEAVHLSPEAATVKTIGVDGIADARKAVADGRLTATVAQLPYLMGKRVVELSIATVTTGKSGISEVTSTPVLTKQSLSDKTNPDLQYVR